MRHLIFKHIIYTIILFIFVSCKSDELSNLPDIEKSLKSDKTIVIIKADDLRNMTPNWQLFISNSINNNVPVSIGIISKDMTDINTIASVKKLANLKNSNGDLSVEFWNHGYDHSNKNKSYEFNGPGIAQQIDDIKRSQDFFKNTLGFTSTGFGVPYNQSSKETFEALKSFPEIKVWMCYQKNEKQFHTEWVDPNKNQTISDQSKILLDVKTLSVWDVPLESVKTYLNVNSAPPYLQIQIHPNVWDIKDFVDYQKLIDYLKEKNVIFMTPIQYYNYLTKYPLGVND